MTRIVMTPEGMARAHALLTKKVEELQAICAERSTAHALSGDGWHDNPHFNRLQQLEAEKTREIAELRALLDRATVVCIRPDRRPTDVVAFGSLVRICVRYGDASQATEQVWEIVGYNESDPARRQIAYNSPLGAAIVGLEPGEEAEVTLPGERARVEVIELYETTPGA